jgi:hypothetical protein
MSMGPRGLSAAKRELLASMERLPDTCRFQVVFYNSAVERLSFGGTRTLVPATGENKGRVPALIERFQAEGTTAHRNALVSALALNAEVIFLLTDGGGLSEGEVGAITLRNAGRTTIHVIEVIMDDLTPHDEQLQALARRNNGTFRAVKLEPDS